MAKEKNNISLNSTGSSQLAELKQANGTRRKYKKSNTATVIVTLLLLVSFIYSVTMFVTLPAESVNLSYFLLKTGEKFQGFISLITGNTGIAAFGNLIRYTVIVLAGAALAVSGAVFQGSFKNIIASPSTMGVQSGATLGNMLFLLFCVTPTTGFVVIQQETDAIQSASVLELNLQQFFAIAGSFISIIIVIYITTALGKGRFTTANILFAGTIFSSFTGAISSVINYYFLYEDPDNSRLNAMRTFSLGSFDKVTTIQHLIIVAIFLVPSLVLLTYISPKMNVLVLGEDEARSMGVNVRLYRAILIGTGTLMSAAVFAFCGQIGFMGFIVPQIARKLVGPDFKRLVVMCIVLGALIMIWIYNIALAIGMSMYLNVITTPIGCAMMAYSFIKGKGGKVYDEA